MADHTSSSSAAYRTGAGSTSRQRLGGIVEDGLPKNLRALCQRCHMLHDRPHHLAQRWITYRRRLAVGDLFLGPYPAMIAALTSKQTSQGLRFSRSGEA